MSKKQIKLPLQKKKPELIAASLRAIRMAYKDNHTAPGLVLSFLNEGEWYASIVRYRGGEKLVMHSAKAISWQAALKMVMKAFLESTEVLVTLRDAL